jgi:hypothetical protein
MPDAVAAGQAAVTSARHCNLWSGHNVEAAATGIPRQIGPTAQHYCIKILRIEEVDVGAFHDIQR